MRIKLYDDIFRKAELPDEMIVDFAPKLSWIHRKQIISSTQVISETFLREHRHLIDRMALLCNPKTPLATLILLQRTEDLYPCEKREFALALARKGIWWKGDNTF
jgi:hypothetical protein